MKEPDERYRQLALFTLILAEVALTPSLLAAAAYWIFKGQTFRNLAVLFSAFIGLSIGFYRVYLLQKRNRKNDAGEK
jgi:positive regulator of sigma E activity